MSDYKFGQPVRSEADGTDARLHTKIVDGLNPALRAEVDSDKNLHVELHGNDPAGIDRIVRTSEIGALTPDGVYDATNNTKPGNIGIIAAIRNATPDDTTQIMRLTAVQGSAPNTVYALDVSIHDEAGNPFTASNPMPVTVVDSEGTERDDYFVEADVAGDATSNHIYTVPAAVTLKLSRVWASASGRMKIEVQVETGVATNLYTTRFVGYNSVSHPNIDVEITENITVATGVRVRVIRTNRDNQPQDLHSTISGHEIS